MYVHVDETCDINIGQLFVLLVHSRMWTGNRTSILTAKIVSPLNLESTGTNSANNKCRTLWGEREQAIHCGIELPVKYQITPHRL